MLTGKPLGAAIAAAIRMKGVSKADVARHFGIKPPSISDWCKRGTIDKSKLEELFAYFSDVAGQQHWGLTKSEHYIAQATTATYPVKTAGNRQEVELLRLFRGMNEAARQQLIGMAKLLAVQSPTAAAKTAA